MRESEEWMRRNDDTTITDSAKPCLYLHIELAWMEINLSLIGENKDYEAEWMIFRKHDISPVGVKYCDDVSYNKLSPYHSPLPYISVKHNEPQLIYVVITYLWWE